MRILVVAERVGAGGGMERYLEVVLAALVDRGATVHVLARRLTASPPGTAEQIAWADEHDEPDSHAGEAVERAVATFRPDAAVAHNVMDAAVVEALRAAPRFTYHVHDHRPFCPNGDRVFPRSGRNCTLSLGRACRLHALTDGCVYGPRLRTGALLRRRERLRNAVAGADAIVVASRYVAERAIRSGVPRDRVATLPPPLPDGAFIGTPPIGTDERRTVFFAGRIVPQKGLASLVRALAQIDPKKRPVLRAFGDGPALAAIRGDAAARSVDLDAPGIVGAETLRGAIDEAALVALPSLWAEPFGYVGIEAFARGKPVVAYAGGGIDAWLRDGANGRAVAHGDERALAEAIETLLDDPDLRARLGAQARRDAEQFRETPIVDALLDTYTRL